MSKVYLAVNSGHCALMCKTKPLSGFFNDDKSIFEKMGWTAQLDDLKDAYESTKLDHQWQVLRSKGVALWYPMHKNMQRLYLRFQQYPKDKSMLAPLIFYYAASAFNLTNRATVGVVGAREAPEKILSLTEKTAYTFAKQGQIVVSGYARGVDSYAHAGAIRAKGETVAVLPQGIESIFTGTAEVFLRSSVQHSIQESQRQSWKQYICFLSQFYPTARWQSQRYILRNYTICALSEKVIIMAATDEKSGSFQTALFAKKLGKPLYAFMPHHTPLQSKGNQLLVKTHQATPLNEEELLTLA